MFAVSKQLAGPYLPAMELLSRVHTTIHERDLLIPGDSVLVALSGGPDSVALLHLVWRLRRKMNLSLHAVYINHQIRKQAALEEEKFCEALCDRLKVPLTIAREDIPARAKREKKGLEETARDFRYTTFTRLARELSCTRVALGHHVDDRVETIILRLMRGTGRTGLLGIPVKRGRYVRPLYDLSKSEILAYLKRQELKYCVDRSNEKNSFSRNFVRNRLLPLLRHRLNPSVDRALLGLAETLGEEEAFLASVAEGAFRSCVSETPGGKLALDLSILGGYPLWLRRRLLRRCVQALSADGLPPDKGVVDRLERLISEKGGRVSVPGRLEAAIVDSNLLLRRKMRVVFERSLKIGQPCDLHPLRLLIKCRIAKKPAQIPSRRGSNIVLVDAESVRLPLIVRSVRTGDRFGPLGLDGSKKVGDYLTDRKVPPLLRDEIPAVCDQDGIIWLVGREIADRVKVTERTKKVLKLESVPCKTGPGDEAD